MDEDLNKLVEESQQNGSGASEDTAASESKSKEESSGPSMGTLSFISCAAGSDTGAPDSPSEKEPEGRVLVACASLLNSVKALSLDYP